MTQLITPDAAGETAASHFEALGDGLLPGLLGIGFDS